MKLSTINSIEASSICDNKCDYCPAKEQGKHRDTGYMSMDVFSKALEWVEWCARRGTQQELNLFGVGEPTLNPNIVQMCRLARHILPDSRELHFNTNGNTMTEELALDLKSAGITHIDVTLHVGYAKNPKNVSKVIQILNEHGMMRPGGISVDPIIRPNNWAGQVDWPDSGIRFQCPFLTKGQVMIMSNGDVTTCCIDAFGRGIVGNVFDSEPNDIELKPFDLCETCHSRI